MLKDGEFLRIMDLPQGVGFTIEKKLPNHYPKCIESSAAACLVEPEEFERLSKAGKIVTLRYIILTLQKAAEKLF